MPVKYDMVKGVHGDIDQVPKEFREFVEEQFKEYVEGDIKNYLLDVDIYISIDLRNFYKKVDK